MEQYLLLFPTRKWYSSIHPFTKLWSGVNSLNWSSTLIDLQLYTLWESQYLIFSIPPIAAKIAQPVCKQKILMFTYIALNYSPFLLKRYKIDACLWWILQCIGSICFFWNTRNKNPNPLTPTAQNLKITLYPWCKEVSTYIKYPSDIYIYIYLKHTYTYTYWTS